MTGIDFDCHSCAVTHRGTDGTRDRPWPVLSFDLPDPFLELAPHELREVEITEDLCWIDRPAGAEYFARVSMHLSIRDDPERRMECSPWVSLAEEDVLDILDHLGDDAYRTVYPGRLASALPGCETAGPVPVLVHSRGNLRPLIGPDPTSESPLGRDLTGGITREEAELRIRAFLLRGPLG